MDMKETKQEETAALNMEVPAKLLNQFDIWVKENMFSNRSEAVRYLMRRTISRQEDLPPTKTKVKKKPAHGKQSQGHSPRKQVMYAI